MDSVKTNESESVKQNKKLLFLIHIFFFLYNLGAYITHNATVAE